MKQLNGSILTMISGGKGDNGGAGKHGGDRSKVASTNYGGQANGFVGNSSSGMSKECAQALAFSIGGAGIGGLIAQSAIKGVAGSMVGAGFSSLSSCIGGNNGSSNANNSAKGSVGIGTCNR